MLWIRNDLVRILFYRLPDVDPDPGPEILSFKQGRLSNWQILSVHNGAAASCNTFKAF